MSDDKTTTDNQTNSQNDAAASAKNPPPSEYKNSIKYPHVWRFANIDSIKSFH